jgi:hypothetical protein
VWKRRFDEVIPDRDFLEGRVENVANLGLFVLRRTSCCRRSRDPIASAF